MKTIEQQYTGRELRFLADNYEQAQRLRIETGERIRAVLQGRDETFVVVGEVVAAGSETPGVRERAATAETPDPDERAGQRETPAGNERAEVAKTPAETEPFWIGPDGVARYADDTIKAIQAGETLGPVPMLGRSHHRYWTEERETYRDMMRALRSHPAWTWLEQVKGIGPTLGCKLLARFDATKADNVSSFWAYAGLATVPAEQYECAECGIVRAWPVGYDVTGKHQALGTSKACKGALVKTRGAEDGVRCAQPKPSRGTKASYDQYAKKVLYLVGTSFLKAGGPYEAFYRRERAKADRERPGWADGRKHYLALRKTEKLFLSNLWQIWREALGLPTPDPWAIAHGGHDGKIEPWSMV